MTNIARVRTVISGLPGGPALATHYALDGPALLAPLRAFWESVKGGFPATCNLQVESAGDIIDAATGRLSGSWTGPIQAGVNGMATGAYAAPVGVLVRWETGVVQDGHRVRGRTFLVPQVGSNFANDGSPSAGFLDGLRAASQTFASSASPNFIIWHRPFDGKAATATLPARPARLGTAVIVISSSLSNKAVVLRSRRD